jgi:DnaJ like chaperone protein
MSIWGKIIGGVAGFAMGGPLGALIGAIAGHGVDKLRAQPDAETAPADPWNEAAAQSRQMAFVVAAVALGAKMAKVDGVVTRDEVNAFKQIFQAPPEAMGLIGKIFDQAKREASGFEPYAEQIGMMFRHQPAVLEELLGGLFHIAKADGAIRAAELDYLRRVAAIMGFSSAAFERIQASHLPPAEADPYSVLGVAHDAGIDEIKKAYRNLVKENHPDTLIAQGLPKEFIDLANQKLAAINAAYDTLKKQRGFS